MALFLSEADVTRLLDMPTAIEVVEEAFRQLAAGQAHNVPRSRAQAKGIVLHTMSASANYLGYVGWKAYTTTRDAFRFHIGLYDHTTGQLTALIEADHLGRLRTGATTGVAAKYLAPHGASELGLFGSGRQARTQLEALANVLPLRRARVFVRTPDKREAFCAEMSDALAIDVRPAEQPEDAVRELPVVVTATSSSTPVFSGRDAMPGALVCAVGSNWLAKAEIDSAVIRRASLIVCDSVESCRGEAGDFTTALAAGTFKWDQAVDLAAVVAGKEPRALNRPVFAPHESTEPTGSDRLTLFKSVGMAIEDVALAAKVVELAREQNIGTALPI